MDKSIVHHILIIDDEPMILKLLSIILCDIGFKVDVATSGEAGIKKIELNGYDLILTDIKMPEISGEDVLKYSRNSKNPSTPIIGMSGTPWLLNSSLFNAVLEKPFLKKELFSHIERLLKINLSF